MLKANCSKLFNRKKIIDKCMMIKKVNFKKKNIY